MGVDRHLDHVAARSRGIAFAAEWHWGLVFEAPKSSKVQSPKGVLY
jgi:hypothetical protein